MLCVNLPVLEWGSTNNEDVFRSPSALFVIFFIAPDFLSFFFPLLAFILSSGLLFLPHFWLSSFRSFLRFLVYVFSFPVFRSSFLSFVLSASSPSVNFFVRVKPSY